MIDRILNRLNYYFRILPTHYMTPRRFMNIMQKEVAIRDAENIGGMVGYMLKQDPQPEYVSSSFFETLFAYDYAKKQATRKAFINDANIEGWIAEFGVDDGTSLIPLCGLTSRPVHAFDSWQGLEDGGKWRGGIEHQDQFQNNGQVPFTVPRNAVIVKGWFDKTLPNYNFGHDQAKFVNIDCDNYKASKTVLENISKHIKIGTVIRFDDYFNEYNFRGKTQFTAWQECVKANKFKYEYLYCMAPAVIIKITG